MSDDELRIEKQKLKKSKIFHATAIGFLAGIFIFGIVFWSLSDDKNFGFFIPMLIPVIFIYRILKNRKSNRKLEQVLQERQI